jgi:DNA-binding LytR/AlgR family response regulator
MEKIVIIEDEKLAADKLVFLLKEHAPSFQITAILNSIETAVKWFLENDADLVFLDIELKDGNSFKIFEQTKVNAPIIFTTAYNQYAIKAFKHNGIDYLLKPIDESELKQSLERYYRTKFDLKNSYKTLEKLRSMFLENKTYKTRIIVSQGHKIKSIPVDEIAYVYAVERNVFLTTNTNETFLTDETLDSLEKELEPKYFFRLNRKLIANINSIKEVIRYSSRQLKVVLQPQPKFDIVISAEKVTNFKNWLDM